MCRTADYPPYEEPEMSDDLYRETPPCPFCGHREHLNDVCEEDLGEYGECQCADPRKSTDDDSLAAAMRLLEA